MEEFQEEKKLRERRCGNQENIKAYNETFPIVMILNEDLIVIIFTRIKN